MRNTIIKGDCIEIMRAMPDESVDCIITDPPYGISFCSNASEKPRFGYILNDDNLDFFRPFVNEAFRVLKNNKCIYIFCRYDNYPIFYNVVKSAGFNIKNCLVWEKNKAMGGLGDMEASYLANYEFILLAMKGRCILFPERFGREFGLLVDTTIDSPLKLQYPTQKPVPLIRRLINTATAKGELVLDPFCGSGTTCIAAKQLSRDFIGIDLNPVAVELSAERTSFRTLNEFMAVL